MNLHIEQLDLSRQVLCTSVETERSSQGNMFGFQPFQENNQTNPNASSKEARGKAQQEHQDFCQEKKRNRSTEILRGRKNFL
jgi:hypothetical protein